MLLKKLVGNYKDIVNALGLDEDLYKGTPDDYRILSQCDIPRTTVYNLTNERLFDACQQLGEASFSYSQGDLDGGVFTELALLYSKYSSFAQQKRTKIRVCYLNDDGVVSAFSVVFLKTENGLQNSYLFNLTIIEDVVAQLKDKEERQKKDILFISNSQLLPEQAKYPSRNTETFIDISNNEMVNEVLGRLKCRSLETHVKRLCNGNADSFLYASKLAHCLRANDLTALKALEITSQSPLNVVFSIIPNTIALAMKYPALSASLIGLVVGIITLAIASTCSMGIIPAIGFGLSFGLFSGAITYRLSQSTNPQDQTYIKSNLL